MLPGERRSQQPQFHFCQRKILRDPIVQLCYVEVDEPDMAKPLGDADRLLRAIAHYDMPGVTLDTTSFVPVGEGWQLRRTAVTDAGLRTFASRTKSPLSRVILSGTNTTTFKITGGGADFNLAPKVNLAGKVSLGIQTVTTGNLGDAGEGYLSALKSGGAANVVNGDLTKAQEVVDAAIKQVSGLRGRLGAFQKNVIGSTINSLGVSLENTAAAEAAIRDTDFAVETANFTKNQVLIQAGTTVLSNANALSQLILGLLLELPEWLQLC